jgi:hypothetical protein
MYACWGYLEWPLVGPELRLALARGRARQVQRLPQLPLGHGRGPVRGKVEEAQVRHCLASCCQVRQRPSLFKKIS